MPTVRFILDTTALSNALAEINTSPASPPSLYLDLEGACLSRFGTVSLLTLFDASTSTVYLIDIHTLGASAFSTPSHDTPSLRTITIVRTYFTTPDPTPLTLKSILESPDIPKVFFDVRNDSDALLSHFGIKLHGIIDLQLMELATTKRETRAYLTSLSNCIYYSICLLPNKEREVQRIKAAGKRLFSPELGGSYDVFNERPLRKEVEEYCIQDVVHMPELWRVYDGRLTSGFWKWMVEEETKKRVRDSQSPVYKPSGPNKTLGWSADEIAKEQDRWRERQGEDKSQLVENFHRNIFIADRR